jgi:uncharacterized lipoprotein YddW (UPF0748 family)
MRSLLFSIFIVLLYTNCSTAQTSVTVEPIRGTWITNVASKVLYSKENIEKAVAQCKENGLNNIYVVVWNMGKTIHPSKVTEQYVGIKQNNNFEGRDPLKEMIDAGHKAGIKVHAWFEFGFSYTYKDTNSIWLKKYPNWVGRNNKGELLQKNGFYWWSSINPEVQKFMHALVTEVVKNYDIDGVQGDDRMPAMPGEGGYDDYTLKLYAKEHNGAKPPQNPNDSAWLQWKADQLSAFGKSLYQGVKKIKPTCTVSWAPSIYPWSKENYLQDWPTWLKEGYADYIIPQLYRYNLPAYEKILKELKTQVPTQYLNRVFPGILTSLGDGYQSTRELTDSMIQLNRKYGFNGEVFFYFETLNRLKSNFYTNK